MLIRKGLAVGIVLLFLASSVVSILVEGDRNQTQSEPCEKTINIFENDIYRLPEGYPNVSSVLESIEPTEYADGNQPIQSMSDDGEGDSPWPMQGHDAMHSGRGIDSTERNFGQDLWMYPSQGNLYGSPVIDSQGTIYICAFNLYALNSNGTLKWFYPNKCTMETAPAIGDDGTIYYGTSRGVDDRFYAFNSNGTFKWFIPTSEIMASPVINPGGTIIFPNSHANKLVALYPNGTKKWEFPTNHVIYSTPAVGPDGTVYVGSHDGYIYAVNPNGSLKWSFLTGAWVHGSPSIASDGTVYCGSDDGYLYALYPNNGSMKWRLAIGACYASPTISLDGTLYLGVWEKRFYAINPDGTVKWSFDTSPGKVWGSTAALSADGTLYFATADLEWSGGVELIALWTNGTVKWRRPLSSTFSSPAIGRDGTVYIGNTDYHGQLRAFGYGLLQAEANGPYNGDDQTPINFTGSIIGGLPPYTFHWNFGDGGTSNEQNPSYRYTTIGTYTATFTIRDSEGNESSDTANITVTYALPSITMTKPIKDAIYFMNIKIRDLLPHYGTKVIGPIMVKVDAYQEPFGIDRVEFYLDDKLVSTDTQSPYRWAWVNLSFGEHKIHVYAYDTSGNQSYPAVRFVKKFF
jgi:outer membrane protein assembly factor BamB